MGGLRTFAADKITGTARSRPELDRLLDQLGQGDVITVTKYDRLARSLRDLLDFVDTIQAHGAGFRALAQDIDTTTPAGRLVFHVFASIAQFERERISERTKEGLEAAHKRGRVVADPLRYPPHKRPRCDGCVMMSCGHCLRPHSFLMSALRQYGEYKVETQPVGCALMWCSIELVNGSTRGF